MRKTITQLTGFRTCGRDRARELIRIRDNHTCQKCGKKWKEGERRFDVHHKDFNAEKSRQVDVLEKEAKNMITLCHKCHLGLPEHKEKSKWESKGKMVVNLKQIELARKALKRLVDK